MTLDPGKLLDETGRRLLRALQENGRLSFAELGRQVGLSLPAAAERVRRLEEAAVITGYRAEVDPGRLGRPVMAFIRLTVAAERYPVVIALLQGLPEVMECHHLTGDASFLLKVLVPSVADLEELIKRLSSYGQTATSIVLSSPVTRRIVEPGPG